MFYYLINKGFPNWKCILLYMKNEKKRTFFKRFIIGLKVGWNTPTLPDNILKLQLHPLVRILRVLGGISTLYLLSNKASQYSIYIFYFAFFFCLSFFIYHIYISYHRIKHIYKTLKSDKLDIKNSPLDHFARLSARLLLCAKGVCDHAQPVGVAMGILLGIDTSLIMADQKPIFGPILGSAIKTVLSNEVKTKVSDLIKEPISQIERNNREINELNDIIDKVSDWGNSSQAKNDAHEIISELNKHKSYINKNSTELQIKIIELLKSDSFGTKKQ